MKLLNDFRQKDISKLFLGKLFDNGIERIGWKTFRTSTRSQSTLMGCGCPKYCGHQAILEGLLMCF